MRKYRIFWIDDEHDGMAGFKASANMDGIELVPFKSMNKGMDELRKNYNQFDGVLLDAKIFADEIDVKGTEDVDYVFRVKDQLQRLPKKFEIFVYTGQAELFNDKSFHRAFKNVYKKGDDTDEDRLFEDLKKAADQQLDTQLRHEFHRVFEVCTEKYIGENAAEELLYLLKIEDDNINTDKYLNTIRKIIEDLFSAFNRYELLPDEFVINNIALNESSRFLYGESMVRGFEHLPETHIQSQIADNLKNVLHITQPTSHRSDLDKHIKEIKTPFLFKSTLYLLLDIIVWFKIHIDSNPKKKNWKKAESIFEGEIGQDENNNYYCGPYYLTFKIVEKKYKIGDKIRILIEEKNTNKWTSAIYPKFAAKFVKA